MTGSWDQPNQDFDQGGVYDTNSLREYKNLVTSEHRDKILFMRALVTAIKPMVDIQTVIGTMLGLFDLDTAVGVQLDDVGEWVGISRFLKTPLTGVYFSFDTDGLGFDQGTWQGRFDPDTGLTRLADEDYRTLLRAKIANNQWDGTIPGAYAFMSPVFPGDTFFIEDNCDMTMYVGVIGPVPLNAVTYALLTEGYLDVKPVGVRILGYLTPSVPATPLFGFDVNNNTIAGFDSGSWALINGGN